MVAKPYLTPVPISNQLMPPLKPPLPVARNRWFHSSGQKIPKVYEETSEEVTLTIAAQRLGRLVAFLGYAISPSWPKEPPFGICDAYNAETVLLPERSELIESVEHSGRCLL